jgi:hypothetical protein
VLVAGFGQDGCRDGGYVGGVDGRDRHVRPRRSDDVPLPELGEPAQRVRVKPARTQDRPRDRCVAYCCFGLEPHAGDGVVGLASDDAARREQHDVFDSRVIKTLQDLGERRERTEEERFADPGERRREALGIEIG